MIVTCALIEKPFGYESSGYVSHELHFDYTLSLCVIQVCIPLVERKGDNF
jgi:hypothetical protein